MPDPSTVTLQIIYSGRVQGVGFRATAQAIAGRFPIAGFVKNRPDRTVELVAQGAPEVVQAFLEAVADRLARQIEGITESPISVDEPLEGFRIHR